MYVSITCCYFLFLVRLHLFKTPYILCLRCLAHLKRCMCEYEYVHVVRCDSRTCSHTSTCDSRYRQNAIIHTIVKIFAFQYVANVQLDPRSRLLYMNWTIQLSHTSWFVLWQLSWIRVNNDGFFLKTFQWKRNLSFRLENALGTVLSFCTFKFSSVIYFHSLRECPFPWWRCQSKFMQSCRKHLSTSVEHRLHFTWTHIRIPIWTFRRDIATTRIVANFTASSINYVQSFDTQ